MLRNNMDGSYPLVREMTSRTADSDGDYFSINRLELLLRQGFNAGSVELSTSRDGGVTWGNPKPKAIGPIGKYGNCVCWTALGAFKQATVKLRISDAIEVSFDAEMRLK